MNISLSKIEVVSLFGYLNYSIEQLDEHSVTFLIGKNGVGKTTILRLIEGLASKKWELFRSVEFASLTFHFDVNDTKEQIAFIRDEKGVVKWKTSNVHDDSWTNLPSGYAELTKDTDKVLWLEKYREEVQRASCGRHWTVNGRGHYDEKEVLEEMQQYIQKELTNSGDDMGFLSSWIATLIPYHRLLTLTGDKNDHTLRRLQRQSLKPVVNVISEQMRAKMQGHVIHANDSNYLQEHEFLSSLLDDTNQAIPARENLIKRLKTINQLESRVQRYGLYPETKKLESPDETYSDNQIRILDIYLTDREKRIQPHKEFLKRLNLFDKFIETAFDRKSVKPDRDEGLVAIRDETIGLKLDQLSSGEQHLIILAYKILFEIPQEAYVLIDEPELSMDLEWQENFVDMLEKVGDLRNLQFLCATHSPSIVDSRISALRSIKPT